MNKIIILFLLFCASTQAQLHPSMSFNIGAGTTHYRGDLGNGFDKTGVHLTASIAIREAFRFLPILQPIFEVNYGDVYGQELFLDQQFPNPPNTYFRTNYLSVAAGIKIGVNLTRQFYPHLTAKVGYMYFNPLDEEGNELITQLDTREENETYSRFTLFLPLSFGVDYYLKTGFGLSFEASFYYLFTDYIDNISVRTYRRERFDMLITSSVKFIIPLKFDKTKSRWK